MAIEVNPIVWREGVVKLSSKKLSPQINSTFCSLFQFCFILFFTLYVFFASKAPISTEVLAGIGLFLASLLGMANNTTIFTATSTKKFELHILAPLSTWKNCKNYHSVVLDVEYIGLPETANKKVFLIEIIENLWSVKYANPSGHNTTHSKYNFRKKKLSHFERLDPWPKYLKNVHVSGRLSWHGIAW